MNHTITQELTNCLAEIQETGTVNMMHSLDVCNLADELLLDPLSDFCAHVYGLSKTERAEAWMQALNTL